MYVLKTTNSDLSTSLIQPTLGDYDEVRKYVLNNIDSGNTYKHTFKVIMKVIIIGTVAN